MKQSNSPQMIKVYTGMDHVHFHINIYGIYISLEILDKFGGYSHAKGA